MLKPGNSTEGGGRIIRAPVEVSAPEPPDSGISTVSMVPLDSIYFSRGRSDCSSVAQLPTPHFAVHDGRYLSRASLFSPNIPTYLRFLIAQFYKKCLLYGIKLPLEIEMETVLGDDRYRYWNPRFPV